MTVSVVAIVVNLQTNGDLRTIPRIHHPTTFEKAQRVTGEGVTKQEIGPGFQASGRGIESNWEGTHVFKEDRLGAGAELFCVESGAQ